MTIINITEIQNKNMPKFQVIKENQDIYIPGIDANNISKRNGMVYILTGSGGSGKTNLLLNLFKNRHCYRNKFHNLFYFARKLVFYLF
jgi:alpha-D-ribose 1-methylphosphonate 5-triphosphate synthase subunit PhnL